MPREYAALRSSDRQNDLSDRMPCSADARALGSRTQREKSPGYAASPCPISRARRFQPTQCRWPQPCNGWRGHQAAWPCSARKAIKYKRATPLLFNSFVQSMHLPRQGMMLINQADTASFLLRLQLSETIAQIRKLAQDDLAKACLRKQSPLKVSRVSLVSPRATSPSR